MIQFEFAYVCVFVTWWQALGKGTIEPESSIDSAADADHLHAALTSSKTRIKDLVDLLTKRSCAQRMEIKDKFEQKYGPGSLDQLISVPASDSKDCRYDLLLPSCFVCNATLNAYHAGKTIMDDSISVHDITDIMVFSSQTQEFHNQFTGEFERINKIKLTDWIGEHTEDDFHNVLMEIATRIRLTEPPENPDFIATTAQALIEEKDNWEDDRKAFDAIMWQTPLGELKNILHAFEQQYGGSLYDQLWKLEGDKAYVYQTIYDFAANRTEFYSKELNRCFDKKYFNGLLFMRIVLITCETDLAEIKQAYLEDYNVSLEDELKQILCFKDNEEYRSLLYGFLDIPVTPL